MKKIAILGSTGSIGTQALDLVRSHPEQFQVTSLACGKNIALLSKQIAELKPALAVVAEEQDAVLLRKEFPKTNIMSGMDGLVAAASHQDHQMVLNALVGMMGLIPTYAAIQAGKDIALANKETLVAGGDLIIEAAREHGVKILPVDSEHSAVFQCLEGNHDKEVKRIILTASGGPFRGFTRTQLSHVTLEEALNHPKWKMGSKITIDSATLMNKGLEVIEASKLFRLSGDRIDVVVHPQSIIHSMVEYQDRSILAQMGDADMRIPISYALHYPNRLANDFRGLELLQAGSLTFEQPDLSVFTCLRLAYDTLKAGSSYAVVLNAANEVLVSLFLQGRIKFLEIQDTIEKIIHHHVPVNCQSLEEILEVDRNTRREVLKWVS